MAYTLTVTARITCDRCGAFSFSTQSGEHNDPKLEYQAVREAAARAEGFMRFSELDLCPNCKPAGIEEKEVDDIVDRVFTEAS